MNRPGKSLLNPDPVLRRVALGTSWGFLATGLGSGLVRVAPGTAGTLVAVPFALVLVKLPLLPALVITFSLFMAGVAICRMAAASLNQSDPGAIVWDEMVGFCLVVVLAPDVFSAADSWGWAWLAGAFAAFRVFDILKPWPIRAFERRLHGGFGIMFDDLIAALYAAAVLHLANLAFA